MKRRDSRGGDASRGRRGGRNGLTSHAALLGLMLVAALVIEEPAFAQSFLGKWTATAHTPGGETSEILIVIRTDDGYSITAKLAGPDADGRPEAGPGEEIVLEGDSFSYKRTLGELEIIYEGIVSGDTFTGTAQILGVHVPYTGVRLADASSASTESDD